MITLIIPAYNEKLIIENTIKIAYEYLSNNFKEYEIIVVDDGSSDGTWSGGYKACIL